MVGRLGLHAALAQPPGLIARQHALPRPERIGEEMPEAVMVSDETVDAMTDLLLAPSLAAETPACVSQGSGCIQPERVRVLPVVLVFTIPMDYQRIVNIFDALFNSTEAEAEAEAEAHAHAVRTVLDPAADSAARAAAITAIRTARTSFETALRTISDDDVDHLTVARAVFETVVAEHGATDLDRTVHIGVETAIGLSEHAVAIDIAERALAAAPDSVMLAILLTNVRANRGTFDPTGLAALRDRNLPIPLRRRLDANLGVAYLATGRIREAFTAWRLGEQDAQVLMMPDAAVTTKGEPVWIQRMRALLQLDGLGEQAVRWGIGGPRMAVLLEGLAGVAADADAARLLRAEADTRLRTGCERFAADPESPDVTLEDLLADAADFARGYGLDEMATRIAGALS
jgi:hypothetical protein